MRNRFDLGKVEEMKSEMKFGASTLFAMICTLVIGCSGGGSKSTTPATPVTYTIGGTVAGLTGAGLVLENAGGNSLTVGASAISFSFSAPVSSSAVYSVTVSAQPVGESCTVANGSGTATTNVSNIAITCTSLDTIGGTITGLSNPGLVLQDNGGDRVAVDPSATSFTFPTPIASGGSYLVAVLAQPLGESCLVANGSGTATAAVTNVTVSCTPLYEIGGIVTGLNGAGLVLQNNGGDNLSVSAHAANFTFPTPVGTGGAYSITVLTQPTSENCAVTNGSGTATTNVTNASVVCVGDWTWTGGSGIVGLNGGQPGVYGTLGISAPANLPGARDAAVTWTDASNNVWLFGGSGKDVNGTSGQLNDLWKFNPNSGTNGEWTWINGSSVNISAISTADSAGAPGVYGTIRIASPMNAPGGRHSATSWTDSSGNLWLFGGFGLDANGSVGFLNDLWEFDLQAGEWAWMAGSSTVPHTDGLNDYFGAHGVYGTLGTPATTNIPGGRYGATAWTDKSGNFWLLGGSGYDATTTNGGNNGLLNDLWEYTQGENGNPGSWTWMGGSSTAPPNFGGPFGNGPSGQKGVYGTLGAALPENMPGGRQVGASWTDSSGNFWLFGGFGTDSAGTTGYLNDLWEYTPGANGTIGEWAWLSGSETIDGNGGQPGVYGIEGTTAATNVPGARFSASAWVDPSHNFWVFGGRGYDLTDTVGLLNDVWRYTPGAGGAAGQWTWMGGSDVVPPPTPDVFAIGQPGVYGTLGTAASGNTPGGRAGAVAWVDGSGNLHLLGGQGTDSTGNQGELNDWWQYQP